MISPFQSCSITGNVIFFSYTVKGSKALLSRMKQRNALITSLLLIAPRNVGWDQISNNFQASSRDKTVPWREYMHKGRRHRCCVQWHGGGSCSLPLTTNLHSARARLVVGQGNVPRWLPSAHSCALLCIPAELRQKLHFLCTSLSMS